MNLVNAQQARRILDRIVGYQISPFLWKTVKSGLSAGRVQSVATRIIVEREKEIESFIPDEYWTIDASLVTNKQKTINARFYGDKDKKIKIANKEQADNILNAISDGQFQVCSVKKGKKQRNPAPPFITSTLQQEASRKLNFQSQKTMKLAQELYEGINVGVENGGVLGLITYMRTDSLRVSEEAQKATRQFIFDKFGDKYCLENIRVFKTKSNAQDAHEAIRPSKVTIEPSQIKKYLTNDQFKLYKLIWERFVASQMSNAEISTVVVDIENGGYIFRTSGYNVNFPGYMAIYQESIEETQKNLDDAFNPEKNSKLPEITSNEVLLKEKIDSNQHFTEPPFRYDEASLIKFLEEKGIGRPSTYTPIITVILARGYVAREGKFLKPTPLGEITTKIMNEHFPDIVNYKFTANMENNLDTIESGAVTMESVLGEFYVDFEKELDKASKALNKGDIEVPVEETDIICDLCGSKMIVKNGKFGKFAACPNYPKCKCTKPLNAKPKEEKKQTIEVADFKCEICGSDMVLRKGKFGDFYACSNYPKCKNTKTKTGTTGIKCPDCGAEIISKFTKSKKQFFSCENYPKCSFSTWDTPIEKKCPKCDGVLLKKKNKNLVYCHNKKCGYKAEEND